MFEVLQTVLMMVVVVEETEDGDVQKDVGQEKLRGLYHLLHLPLLLLTFIMFLAINIIIIILFHCFIFTFIAHIKQWKSQELC